VDTRFDGLSHVKSRLLYHVVLATKYRRCCLLGLEHRVYDSLASCEAVSDFDILSASVDDGNHLHLLVQLRKPGVSIGAVIRRIKQRSLRDLWSDEDCRVVLSRFYHGHKRRLWSSGYFVATVGNDVDVVSSYIRNQGVVWR
jgi:REP element-mobilizing transposase RayT